MSNEPIFSSNNIIIETFTPKIGNKSIQKSDLRDYDDDDKYKSWRYLPQSDGLHSTQQISVDWTDFSQHTFFGSAEMKVNAAFQKIVNHFPFDGSQKEKQQFYDSLTGYEDYIYSVFPKYVGYLKFNGSDNKIIVRDSQGYLFPALAKSASLQSVIGSGVKNKGFTIEAYVNPPNDGLTRDNQILFQKLSSDGMTGITLALSRSLNSESTVALHAIVSSGSGDPAATRNSTSLHVSASLQKGDFTHFACIFDKGNTNKLSILKNGKFLMSSSNSLFYEKLDFIDREITIGSGSDHITQIQSGAPTVTPMSSKALFSGSLDELRFWTEAKTQTQISESFTRPVIDNTNLALYYKFNEPTGSYGNVSLVLDSSGNGLHAHLTNYEVYNREKEEPAPIRFESEYDNPVLFPDYPTILSTNIRLLTTASNYDIINPNMILKLIPEHYLREDNIQPIDPALIPEFTSSISLPRGGQLPSNQIIANFLYIWANFFDDVKMYIDSMSDIASLNYQDIDGIPQNAIEMVAKQYGFELPNIFFDATPEQFNLGRNLNENVVHSSRSLKSILNSIWRRVATEIPHITRTKGTISSIKMLMNSFGIDADSNFRLREFGSVPGTPNMSNTRRERQKNTNAINFDNSMFMSTDKLTAFRWEPGYPGFNFGLPVFNAANRVFSNHARSISLTSGSWTLESHYLMAQNKPYATQSLMRVDMSGSDGKVSPFVNVLAYSGSFYTPEDYKVRLVVAASGSDGSNHKPNIDIEIPNLNIFDGSRWYVNVSREIVNEKSKMSLRVIQTNKSRIYADYATSSFMTEVPGHPFKAYERADNILDSDPLVANPRPMISVGKKTNYDTNYLNNTTNKSSGFSQTDFCGKLFNLRFWSKALTDEEIEDHALNPFSFGAADPITNSPYLHPHYPSLGMTGSVGFIPDVFDPNDGMIHVNSGSWERLRVHVDIINNITASDASGNMIVHDLSRNGYNFLLSNSSPSSKIIETIPINYSYYDPNWDNPSVTNKIRVRSFLNEKTADRNNATHGTQTDLDPRETIFDDRRFSIEASIAQQLNEDMASAISDIFFFENAVGAPEMLYSIGYPDLEKLSEKYFNRLQDKVDFKNYFTFFKWFETNFSSMVEKLIPNTTEFLGINFVIESHMLERHKVQYQQADVHIDLSRRLAAQIERITFAAVEGSSS